MADLASSRRSFNSKLPPMDIQQVMPRRPGKPGSKVPIDENREDEQSRRLRVVWLVAIRQALQEACGIAADSCGKTKEKQRMLLARRARVWLTGNSRDFQEVCELAGVNPDTVKHKALALEANGWVADFDIRAMSGPRHGLRGRKKAHLYT